MDVNINGNGCLGRQTRTQYRVASCVRVRVCVCVYEYMYVCMYVCMYVWMDGWMDGWWRTPSALLAYAACKATGKGDAQASIPSSSNDAANGAAFTKDALEFVS